MPALAGWPCGSCGHYNRVVVVQQAQRRPGLLRRSGLTRDVTYGYDLVSGVRDRGVASVAVRMMSNTHPADDVGNPVVLL